MNVLYFGMLKDFFGGERDVVELGGGASVADLMTLLRGRGTVQATVWASLAVAVNQVYASVGTILQDGDEVALLPPVSGGSVDAHISEAKYGVSGFVGDCNAR